MTATVRTAWADANGNLIVPGRSDAALASMRGGPADGQAWIALRCRLTAGFRPPSIVGARVKGQHVGGRPVIAWYRRDDEPARLTYRFMHCAAGWPAMGATA